MHTRRRAHFIRVFFILVFLEDDYFYFDKCGAKEQILNDTINILGDVFLFFDKVLGIKTNFLCKPKLFLNNIIPYEGLFSPNSNNCYCVDACTEFEGERAAGFIKVYQVSYDEFQFMFGL